MKSRDARGRCRSVTEMGVVDPTKIHVIGDPLAPRLIGQTEFLGSWNEECLECRQSLADSSDEFWYEHFGGCALGMHLACFVNWYLRLGADATTAARLLRHREADSE